jgi:hypothetical protein
MAVLSSSLIALTLLGVGAEPESGPAVLLRESARVGESTRNQIALKAEGLYRPSPAPGESQEKAPKPSALKIEARLDFEERVLAVDPAGAATRVIRRMIEAASAINNGVRPTAAALRPEVALLVAERHAGDVVVFSPQGPLTRPELEMVQTAGDPLTLAALLPPGPVRVGDRWTVGNDAARALSGYDALAVNKLEARLEALDETTARISLAGEVRGAVLGGEGTITCNGSLTFDRKAGRISGLTVNRAEGRKPSPVEGGLDIKSTVTVERRAIEMPAALADDALAALALASSPERELLILIAPGGQYSLLHDRDWHLFWDDVRLIVLKRLDRGEVVAQCNLSIGPNAGKGRHQDLGQFRDDIRRALGTRFGAFVGEGEVDGDPAGGFLYKVSVQGRGGKVGILWNYFLAASPEGDQLLATFTLVADQARNFGTQDLQIMGTLHWRNPPEPAAKP